MTDEILSSRLEGTKLIIETRGGTQSYDSKFLVAALLVFVARGSGQIEPEESAKMIELIEELAIRGGGVGLFVGCAAGDTAAAICLRVDG